MTVTDRSSLAAAPGAQTPTGSELVVASMAYCRQIARKKARNFYYGLKLTAEPKRSALYAIYAFMRACDDLADAPAGGSASVEMETRLARIEFFRRKMQAILDRTPQEGLDDPNSVWPAFAHVVRTYPLQPAHLHAVLDGQKQDMLGERYPDFQTLYDYCYKVAGVVGLVCLSVWGFEGGEQTLKMAEARGIALQLTNILRDVVEDAQRGRVYLPEDELARFGYDAQKLRNRQADAQFDELMRFQVERARGYYQQSDGLEERVDAACRPTCWAMMRIYRGLLEKIAEDPRRVLTQRIRLSSAAKLSIALRAKFGMT